MGARLRRQHRRAGTRQRTRRRRPRSREHPATPAAATATATGSNASRTASTATRIATASRSSSPSGDQSGGQPGGGGQGAGPATTSQATAAGAAAGRDRNREGQPGVPGAGPGAGPAAGAGTAPGGPEEFVGEPVDVEGFLDLRDEGYGFLRVHGYLPSKDDVYVSVKQVRQLSLRKGDYLKGAGRPASRNEKNPALLRIDEVNGKDPEQSRAAGVASRISPRCSPTRSSRWSWPTTPANMTARIIDLICADRQGPARPHRVAAQGRQDHGDEADRPVDRDQPPRRAPHRAARRRAPRGGHRLPQVAHQGRGRGVHLRPAVRGAHAGGRAHHRAGQAHGRGRPRRLHHPRRHHPPVPGLQPGSTGQRPDHVRRHRRRRALPARRSSSAPPATARRVAR